MLQFSMRLDLTSVILVDGTNDQWDIVGAAVDNSGLYFATDVIVGDIVYSDASIVQLGISRFVILSIDSQTDFFNLYARVQWNIIGQDPTEPFVGVQSFVGRLSFGSVPVPSITVQQLDESFVNAVRNFETIWQAQFSFNNRIYNQPLIGLMNGINTEFDVLMPFIADTVAVYLNGQKLNLGEANDYITLGVDRIILNEAPIPDCVLRVDYNRLT